jgi:hypothetical protein
MRTTTTAAMIANIVFSHSTVDVIIVHHVTLLQKLLLLELLLWTFAFLLDWSCWGIPIVCNMMMVVFCFSNSCDVRVESAQQGIVGRLFYSRSGGISSVTSTEPFYSSYDSNRKRGT